MKDVTICTVSFNGLDAVSLMWESYLKYHERPVFFAYDNNSNDGTRQYLRKHTDFLYESKTNDYHGRGLDYLCKRVDTEYTLTVDTDIEFLKPTIPMMIEYDAFAVHQKKWWNRTSIDKIYIGEHEYESRWRFMAFVTLFKTKELQNILKHFSFSMYKNDEIKSIWDTSGMIYQISLLLGHKIVEIDMFDYYKHYQSVTVNNEQLKHNPDRLGVGAKSLKLIRQRLMRLRGEIPESARLLMD